MVDTRNRTYDVLGRLISKKSKFISVKYKYDYMDRCTYVKYTYTKAANDFSSVKLYNYEGNIIYDFIAGEIVTYKDQDGNYWNKDMGIENPYHRIIKVLFNNNNNKNNKNNDTNI